ncbi:MarR family transcriptional regulator [Thiomicrorhabdus indica]|uniref:MarR family transcriptional regulator n=1 Tax=Thiomicrorhabdus indica TaxID=2267253 RepID=UPI00102D88A9|nr:winged helix-turn-helix domain-containing protein [Thiomicrorhabdus indica]
MKLIVDATTQEKLIALITAHPKWTQKQFANALGMTSDGVKYHLNKLKQAGLIERVGSTKAGSWHLL